MRNLILILFIIIQNLNAAISEYKFNGIRVIICDDFFLPVAKVGVIYHVGSNQLRNKAEEIVVQENLISVSSKRSIKKLGAYCDICIFDEFTEISSVVSPEKVSEFVRIILNNVPVIGDLPELKKRIEIENKLSDYFESNAVQDEISSCFEPKNVFNESLFKSLTKNDCKEILKRYETVPLDIIICGKLNPERLIEEIRFLEGYSKRYDKKPFTSAFEVTKKDIEMRGKFFSRSINFIYRVPYKEIPENFYAIMAVIKHEIFNYFSKNSQIINGYDVYDNHCSRPFSVGFSFDVKRDLSLLFFEQNYRTFLGILKEIELSAAKLSQIAEVENLLRIDEDESVESIYCRVFERYMLNQKSLEVVPNDIVKVSKKDIKRFVEDVMEKNLVLKLVTRYKADS